MLRVWGTIQLNWCKAVGTSRHDFIVPAIELHKGDVGKGYTRQMIDHLFKRQMIDHPFEAFISSPVWKSSAPETEKFP